MKLVVDASVAVKLATVEENSDIAERIILKNPAIKALLAPDFMLVEVGNVLWKKMKLGHISQNHVDQACTTLPTFFTLISSNKLLTRSLEIAQTLDHPVYDCFYLSAAEFSDAKFVTDDRKFALKVRAAGFGDRVQLLQPD